MEEKIQTMWKKLMKFNDSDVLNQLSLYYGSFLPIEVRCHLAEWIENTVLELLCVDPQDPNYDLMTKKFQRDFIDQMIHRSKEMNTDIMIPTKMRFNEAIQRFRYTSANDLFSRIADILRNEYQLLGDFEKGNYAIHLIKSREVDNKIEKLKDSVNMFHSNDISNWTKVFYDYQQEYYMINGNNSPLNNRSNDDGSPAHLIEMNLHTSSLSYMLDVLKKTQLNIYEKLNHMKQESEVIFKIVIEDYVGQWRRNQLKYDTNDFSINGANIDKMNIWCSHLGTIFSNLYETITSLQENIKQMPNDTADNFSNILSSQSQIYLNLLIRLIRESLIVENQPPQVIKTNTRFSSSVRLLIGDSLNNKILNGTVKASIVSEIQAKSVNNTNVALSCGEIVNDKVNIDVKEGALIGNFKSMILKKFKRHGKKSCEMVTDEKFAIVFTLSIDVFGRQIIEKILSHPIVVTVHGSQEINAIATILWDQAFARTNRQNFDVSETITWKEFADALSHKFLSLTGRGLTAENIHCLAEKIYDQTVPFPVPDDNLISWTLFCKEKLQSRDFTFWEWFYGCLKLTKDHLKSPWYDGHINGFIDKKKTEEYLSSCPDGTFILRYSDSEIGALSIAWLNAKERDDNGRYRILHIRPIKSKEFEVININQRIHDVEELTYLYPNVPKHEAFPLNRNPLMPNDYISFRTVMRVDIISSK